MPQPYSTVVVYTHTATDNLQFRLLNTDLWLSNANIHVLTQNALYGKVNNQPATVTAGNILTYDNFNLADLFFRNAGAGANTVIYCVGITMLPGRKKELLLEV